MIGLNSIYKEYKLIYLDTNVISNICKEGELINKFIAKFPFNEKYLLCYSTYTLYEISRNKTLYKDFKEFYSVYPCVFIVSYFPLGMKEIDFMAKKTPFVNPILLSPQGIKINGENLNPNSLDELLIQPNVLDALANVEKYTTQFYDEVLSILDKPEFAHLNIENVSNKKGDFVRTFM